MIETSNPRLDYQEKISNDTPNMIILLKDIPNIINNYS